MSATKLAFAVVDGEDEIRGQIDIAGCQTQKVAVTVAPGELTDVGVIKPSDLKVFFAKADGELTLSTDADFVKLEPGVPVIWYEGIGFDIADLLGDKIDFIEVVNRGEEPVGLSLLIVRDLSPEEQSDDESLSEQPAKELPEDAKSK